MKAHYNKMIKDTEQRVVKSFQIQVLDKNSSLYGGFYDADHLVQAKYAIYRVMPMAAAYLNQDTCYYHNAKVYERMMLGLDYIQRVQHENGLFDYITCNFNSAPDTAFCVKKMMPVYCYLMEHRTTAEEEKLYERLGELIHKGGKGLLVGGFHTPNHRWAIASVLCKLSTIFNDDSMREGAMKYLNEGIDCNEDGEFSEKSAGNYNRINNDAMIMLSEALNDPSYEQYAIRNLRMMLTYWEPDQSVFTANSTRFDKDHLCFPKDYYMEYLSMGMKYQIPEFLQMCNTIFDIVAEKNITSPDMLIQFMLHPEYKDVECDKSYVQDDFNVFYKESGIARVHGDGFTYTMMNQKSNFFYFHTGTMKVEMKVAGSFCEHRAFIGETMEKVDENTYHIHQTMRGWYYLPFEEKPETADWWKMDNTKRKKRLGPNMEIDVYATKCENGVDVRVVTSGVKGAPWRIELAVNGADLATNNHFAMPLHGNEAFVIKDEVLELMNDKDSMLIGPAFGTHNFIDGKEDSELRSAGSSTIYFTDYTEFDHTISFRRNKMI